MVYVLFLFKDVDECKLNLCKNGVICINICGLFICICNLGWIGFFCD